MIKKRQHGNKYCFIKRNCLHYRMIVDDFCCVRKLKYLLGAIHILGMITFSTINSFRCVIKLYRNLKKRFYADEYQICFVSN